MPWPMRFGPGAEDDHPWPVGRPDLGLVLPRRVVVRRRGGELGGARVDRLVRRLDAVQPGGRPARPSSGMSQRWASWASLKPSRLARRHARRVERGRLAERRRARGAPRRSPASGRGTRCRCGRRRGSRSTVDAAPQQLADLEDPLGRRARRSPPAARRRRGRPARPRPGRQLSPRRPCSSERSAFCRLSGNVRPIAIASPTDCICVPSTPVVPGSFSNAQRGIFVTT